MQASNPTGTQVTTEQAAAAPGPQKEKVVAPNIQEGALVSRRSRFDSEHYFLS